MNTPDFTGAAWRKSSRSGDNGGQCVEVAVMGEAVAMRDSKNPTGPALVFASSEFGAFVNSLIAGEFNQR